jgi:peptidase E
MKKLIFFLAILFFLTISSNALAHQPRIIYLQEGDVFVENPEISQAFYDELKGIPRNYFIDSSSDFILYTNLLVPIPENFDGKYSLNIFLINENEEIQIALVDGTEYEWEEFYEEFGRDYYLKGPEFEQKVSAGKYRIEVFSEISETDIEIRTEEVIDEKEEELEKLPKDNYGKYVLAIGKTELYDVNALLNIFWQLPFLKITFNKTSPLQFFLTPFGIAGVGIIGAILVFFAIIYYLIGAVSELIKHRKAKTLLLTSSGMDMKKEILKLLQKPAYNVSVGFITTAAKQEENIDYLKKDWNIMRDEMGFNIEEIDIEGKTQDQVMSLLQFKDIIFVEGGNAFYLLNAMKKCNFEKVIRRLLKQGKVYIGVSAGSIVTGKTIKTAQWAGDKNIVKLKDLKGLNLVPFDIFVHYQPEHAELIRKKMPWKWQRRKLKILVDQQAILVQGKDVIFIGEGDRVVI